MTDVSRSLERDHVRSEQDRGTRKHFRKKKRKLTDYLMGGIWRRFERSFKELLGECGKT